MSEPNWEKLANDPDFQGLFTSHAVQVHVASLRRKLETDTAGPIDTHEIKRIRGHLQCIKWLQGLPQFMLEKRERELERGQQQDAAGRMRRAVDKARSFGLRAVS